MSGHSGFISIGGARQTSVVNDNDRALRSVKDDIAPLVAKIDAYAANTTAKVTSGELKTFVREINAANNAIANAAKTGVVKVPNGSGGMVDVFVDRTFLDAASKIIDEAAKKLGNLRVNVGLEATRKFIDNDMPWLKDPIFDPQLSSELRKMSPNGLDALASVAAGLGNLRNAMLAVVKSPGLETAERLRDVGYRISSSLITRAVKELKSGNIAKNPPKADAPEALKKAYSAFVAKCSADKKYVNELCSFLSRQVSGISAAVEHVIAMAAKAHSLKDDAYRTSGALLGVFKGDRSFTSLVESRVHGYADGDIDAALDDVNVDTTRELGSGKFNTVTLVKFNNGSEYVFKPEMAGRLVADHSPLQADIDDDQQITRINGAVQKTADALELGDVMVKTTAGTHKGTFGMFMEKAPGVTAADFRDGKVGDGAAPRRRDPLRDEAQRAWPRVHQGAVGDEGNTARGRVPPAQGRSESAWRAGDDGERGGKERLCLEHHLHVVQQPLLPGHREGDKTSGLVRAACELTIWHNTRR